MSKRRSPTTTSSSRASGCWRTTTATPAAAAQFAPAQLGVSQGARRPAQGLYLSPGNSRYVASGGYVQGEWWITGEEKSQSYELKDKNGVTFGAAEDQGPLLEGRLGRLGSGRPLERSQPEQRAVPGRRHLQYLCRRQQRSGLPGTPRRPICHQNAIANSGIYGGYQQNVTAGVNWYPDNGVAFQFNATHVMSLKSPLNWNPQSSYESGVSPDLPRAARQGLLLVFADKADHQACAPRKGAQASFQGEALPLFLAEDPAGRRTDGGRRARKLGTDETLPPLRRLSGLHQHPCCGAAGG